ncbi:MAG: serine hydrolase domain-containing protein, partial [Planctomycetota bacterium]
MKTLCTLVSAVLTPVAVAQPDFSAVDRAVEALLEREERLPGAAVLVADREGVLHEAYFGGYDRETVVPIASASKIVAATAVMTLVDDGRMALDAPVSTYLPGVFDEETAGPEKAALTIDELFSMTSGLPADGRPARFVNDRGASMRDAVLGIAREIELEGEPGGGFRYGSYGMHV